MGNSKKIYIVDDEPEILSIYQDSLEKKMPTLNIKIFSNGNSCLTQIEEGDRPDLIISDLKMPEMNGYILAKKIFALDARIPVLLNTGWGDLATQSGGAQAGFKKVIEKGIPINEFVRNIEQHLNDLNDLDNPKVENYLQIDHEVLQALDMAPFAIYIKLNDDKFVNLIKSGAPIPKNKIDEYAEKCVTKYYIQLEEYNNTPDSLYIPFRTSTFQEGQTLNFNVYIRGKEAMKRLIPKDTKIVKAHLNLIKKYSFKELMYDNSEEIDYLKYLDKVIDSVIEQPKMQFHEQQKIVTDYTNTKMNKTVQTKHDPNAEEVMHIASVLEKFCSKNKETDFYQLSRSFSNDNVQHHSIRVAFLCIGVIYKILKWRQTGKNKKTIMQFEQSLHDGRDMRRMVITAAMAHDLGRTKSDNEFESLSKSIEFIEKRKNIPLKVLELVAQHKERIDGSGGPNKLMKRQMTIYSQLLSLINYFDELTGAGNSKKDSLIDIQMNQSQFNQGLINVLESVIS